MPKRRDHGQGALYELKDRGLWRGVVDDGFTPEGRRRQRYVSAKTREECVRKLRQLMREVSEGGALDHHTRVADLAKRWLDDAAARLKPKTVSGYRSHVAADIIPALGSSIVSDLRPSDVRRMHSTIFARNVGPATVAGAHRTLSAMLGFAVDEGLIVRNVAEAVDIPRQAPTERDSLTREEAQALLALGDPRWSLALLSGARDGELRALRTGDIDLEAAQITISWTLAEAASKHGCGGTCGRPRAADCPSRLLDIAPNQEVEPLEGRWVLVRPKAYKSRAVPLTREMAEALRAHIDADKGPNPHHLIWHGRGGLPLTNAESNGALRQALERAQIERRATVHWLRHTYTTMAEHAGIQWVVYAGISGHASEGISRRYTHQLAEEARAGVERLDEYLRTEQRRREGVAAPEAAAVGTGRPTRGRQSSELRSDPVEG